MALLSKNFIDLVDHTRNGNATMTGGYGPELVTNGTFDVDSDWTKGTGWTISGGVASSSGAAAVSNLDSSASLVAGTAYEVSVEIKTISQGRLRIVVGSTGETVDLDAVGVHKFVGVCAGNDRVYLQGRNTFIGSIDNISVREAPKVQWAPHNLVTHSEDLTDWTTNTRASVDGNVTTAPDGLTTADKIVCDNTAAASHWIQSNTASGVSSGDTVTLGAVLKAGELDYAAVYSGIVGKGKFFDLANGTVLGNLVSAPDAASITGLGDGWYLCQIEVTASGAEPLQFYLSENGTSASFDGDGTSGVYAWGAHLYRSDLGGMADVPASERVLPALTKYVRTAGRVIGEDLVTATTQSGAITQTASSEGAPWWTAEGTGQWSISGNTLTRPAGGTWESLRRDLGMVVNKTYRLTFDAVVNYGSFSVYRDFGTVILGVSQTGSYEVDFTPVNATNGGKLQFSSGSLDGTISNISVREIDVDPAAARYLPRVNHHVYNGSQWVNKGLLVERKARTNLRAYSTPASNNITVINGTLTDDQAVDIAGNLAAPELVEDTTASLYHQLVLISTAGESSDDVVTFSCFVKRGVGSRNFGIRLRDSDGASSGNNCIARFDLDTGAVYSTVENGTGNYIDSGISDYGNGWFRCHLTGSISSLVNNYMWNLWIVDENGTEKYTGDGVSSLYIDGIQQESASTPSSYIPTSGSSVTRPAESITIPAANLPWPDPVHVTNEELVTNGTFDADTDWTKGTGWTIGSGVATHAAGTGSDLDQAGVLTIGSVYELTLEIVEVRAGSYLYLGWSSGVYHEITDSASPTAGTYTIYFTAGQTELSIRAGGPADIDIDNISVKEINPLALSIQVKGEMTYAEVTDGNNVVPFRWHIDNNSRIIDRLSVVSGSDTGQFIFQQTNSGANDEVGSGANTYSSGVNVPFNIASRHGSNFINGAVDGVALTADTTPVALPDLSATDLELAYDFMGTISLFRIWANDIGDTGIAEASEPSEEATLFLSFDGTENSYVNFDWSE